MKLSVIGASSVATLQLATAVATMSVDAKVDGSLELFLYARDEDRLRAVTGQVATLVADVASVTSTTSLEQSLEGAAIVFVQVRVGGLAARDFDESFPRRAGLPGEETLGPGGFANALRTIPVLDEIFSSIATYAPEAFVLVLTNPAGIARRAGSSHGLNVVEVCEAPHALLGLMAQRKGCDLADLFDHYVGMNHVGFYIPDDEAELEALLDLVPIDADRILEFQALPLAYVRYYVEPDAQFNKQRDKPTRASELMALEQGARLKLEKGESPDVTLRPAPWYSLAAMPVLRSLLTQSNERLLVGTANDARLPSLSFDSTVEGVARIDRTGSVIKSRLRALPSPALALLERHAHYEDLALTACREPKEENILAALRANPMVGDDVSVEPLLEALLSVVRQSDVADAR
jgi:6-phospho-beta-glucosidase